LTPEERETLLRRRLHAALQELSADRDPLDLVGDVPIVEEFADDLAQVRIADARAAGWAELRSTAPPPRLPAPLRVDAGLRGDDNDVLDSI
jgi:hypothetical protein